MIITLRHMLFIASSFETSSFESGSTLHMDPSHCFALIHDPALRSWIQSNDIELCSDSVHDLLGDCFHVRIFADVDDSLSTYYLLRWGNPITEHVYT